MSRENSRLIIVIHYKCNFDAYYKNRLSIQNELIVDRNNYNSYKSRRVIRKAESDKRYILYVAIYVRDMKNFAAMNKVWDAWGEDSYQPARACVQVRIVRPDLRIKLSVIAAKK